jgi:DeoR family fructose operon transcriptional repressor
MFARERHKKILEVLARSGRVELATLCRDFASSPATMRRDLALLEQSGALVRTHGGAVLPGGVGAELSLDDKQRRFSAEKRAIARRVADDLPKAGVILLDSGTTCLEVARLLRQKSDLTIVTNSIPVLADYRGASARLISLGGELRAMSGALVGATAMRWLQNLRVDTAILGASGLDEGGASTTEISELDVKRAMMDRAHRSWLVSDSSKWGHPAGFAFARWNSFERFYTDEGFTAAPPDIRVITARLS